MKERGDHLVISINADRTLSIINRGTKSACVCYIKRRAKNNQPTHYLHIVKDTWRALESFRRRVLYG